LKRERLTVFKHVPAVKTDARHAADGELDGQNVAGFAIWIVRRCPVYGAHRSVGKGAGVKVGGGFGIMVIP